MSSPRMLAAVGLLVATLSACAAAPDVESAPTTTAWHQGPTVPVPSSAPNGWTSTPTGSPTGAPMDDHGDAEPTTPAEVDPAAAAQAEDRAGAFLRAFARTDLAQDPWWAGVQGYFTDQAAAIYSSTDVANVPTLEVLEGSAALQPGASTPYRAHVSVETCTGTYTVVLVRADGNWLVERAIPPS